MFLCVDGRRQFDLPVSSPPLCPAFSFHPGIGDAADPVQFRSFLVVIYPVRFHYIRRRADKVIAIFSISNNEYVMINYYFSYIVEVYIIRILFLLSKMYPHYYDVTMAKHHNAQWFILGQSKVFWLFFFLKLTFCYRSPSLGLGAPVAIRRFGGPLTRTEYSCDPRLTLVLL